MSPNMRAIIVTPSIVPKIIRDITTMVMDSMEIDMRIKNLIMITLGMLKGSRKKKSHKSKDLNHL